MTLPSQFAPRSLSGQLVQSVLMLVLGFWITATVAVAWYVNAELAESLDVALAQSAERLLELAAHELDEAKSHALEREQTAPPTQAPVASPASAPAQSTHFSADDDLHGYYLTYQLVDVEGALLMRSSDAPDTSFGVARLTGFASTPQWRIYTLKHASQALYIHTAEPISRREELRKKTLTMLLLPLLAALPLLAWLVQRSVRQRMGAVKLVTEQVRQRGGKDLAPVDAQGLPSELVALVDNVNLLLERLDDALRSEQSLTANAAHELRTPLAVAQLRLASLLGHDWPVAARTDIESASQAIAQLKRRTEKLLQMSRAESTAALSRDTVCLNDIVQAVMQEFDPSSAHRLQLSAPAEVWVKGDFDVMAIAVRNLIENALRYGGEGMVHVAIQAPDSVTVQDTGPGVTAPQLAELTQRHVRHSHSPAGFGLGLSIVKTIMDRHQGALLLQSPPPGLAQGFEARLRFKV